MIIRKETESDIEIISEIVEAAFQNHPYSAGTEQFIVKALRSANALTISLVAEAGGRVVGHIAFSPVTISDGGSGWCGIGPVAVLPEFQKQGIGRALIQEGLSMLKKMGGKGCVLVGDPGYYERLGFRNPSDLYFEGPPEENFLAFPLGDDKPRGSVTFHEGFHAKG